MSKLLPSPIDCNLCYIDFVEEIKVNFKQAHTRALADFKKHQVESDDGTFNHSLISEGISITTRMLKTFIEDKPN